MAACVKGNKCDEALELFAAMTDKPTTPPLSPPFSSPALPLSPPLSPPQPSDTLKQQSVRLVRDAYSYGTALHALSKKGTIGVLFDYCPCFSISIILLHNQTVPYGITFGIWFLIFRRT